VKRSLIFARLSGTRAFILLFSLYCIGLAGIIRADRLYLDDMGRALYGYADMAPAGRAAAELLSGLFFLHPGTVDASPFTQISAAALLACAALLLCRTLRIRLTPAVVAACLPFGLAPYGLENLSYRFDAPLTAAGALLAVLPFCLPRGKFFAGAALCVFAAASIYQPCLNIYPAVAAFLLLRNLSRGKAGSAALALHLGAPFLLGAVLYALQAPLWFSAGQYGDYIAAHSAIPGPGLLPGTVQANARDYLAMLYGDWSVNAVGPLLILAFAAYCAVLALRLKKKRTAPERFANKIAKCSGGGNCRPPTRHGRNLLSPSTPRGAFPNHYVPGPAGSAAPPAAESAAGRVRVAGTATALPILLFCLVLAPMGVQLALSSPVWSPRTFLAFGPVLTLALLGFTPGRRAGRTAKGAALALVLLIDMQLLIFASLYGNMLSAQNRWEQARFAGLAPVLAAFAAEKKSDRAVFAGSVGYSPLMDVPGQRFPLLRRMTVVPLTRNMRWGYEQLAIYGVAVRPGRAPAEGDVLRPYADTPYFRLDETADGAAFVTFKQATARRSPP
jgi:hypothetical protein